MQADGLGDIVEFLAADGLELFAPGGELFVNLNDFLSHYLMGFLRATHEREIVPGGHALMTIGIKAYAEHQRLAGRLFLLGIRHTSSVRPNKRWVKDARSSMEFRLAAKHRFCEICGMAAKSKRPARKHFKSHFRIYFDQEIALGPGKVELLQHIGETGSISEAARRMDMSYNRAWLLVRTMNRCFRAPLVCATRGGDKHGGAELTATGKQVLGLYHELESKVQSSTRPMLNKIFSQLRD